MPKQGEKQFCLDFCSHAGCKKKKCPHLHASLPSKLDYTVQLFLLSRKGPKSGQRLTKSESVAAQKALRAAEEVKLDSHIKEGKRLRPSSKTRPKSKPRKVGFTEPAGDPGDATQELTGGCSGPPPLSSLPSPIPQKNKIYTS